MQSAPKFVTLGALFTTLLLEGGVLFFMDDPSMRLYVGLALFLVIGWMLSSSQVAEVMDELPDQIRRRRYPRLRAKVQLLLAEVRRLHWTAVDRDRGVRSQIDAVAEMDIIEERMRHLLLEIRVEAGVPSEEADPGPSGPQEDWLEENEASDGPEAGVVSGQAEAGAASDEPDSGPASDEPSKSEA